MSTRKKLMTGKFAKISTLKVSMFQQHIIGQLCFSMVCSGLNLIFSRKCNAFVYFSENVVLLSRHKIDVKEDITLSCLRKHNIVTLT